MASGPMSRAYNAADVEQRIYQDWESKGYFHANIPDSLDDGREPYVIIMPPPNVTGELHLGHALEKALEDALVRWRRMTGVPTLWLPGTDHAGIATQWAVERRLAEEGQDRHELGRERFVELVWDHVEKFGGIIHEQSRRLGISADWERHKFTLDPGPSRAVRTTFVNLYRKGLVYRHERIINWCTRCATALSDLEVDYQNVDGKLYHISYPLAGDPASGVTVATTRPETMLGDTAVAVHPDDPRYDGIRGRQAVLPIMDREIPVVGDDAIDMEFGTGALKVTPGHDTVDFEIGQRHNLPLVNIIGLDGAMTRVCRQVRRSGAFRGPAPGGGGIGALGPAGESGRLPPLGGTLPAVQLGGRAPDQPPVVRRRGPPRPAGEHRRTGPRGGRQRRH